MYTRLAISLAILFATIGCPHRSSVPPAVQPATQVNLTSAADSELQMHLGERVTMQGQNVRVTGTLRFAHYSASPRESLPEGRPSDHFYFEAETAKVELSKK